MKACPIIIIIIIIILVFNPRDLYFLGVLKIIIIIIIINLKHYVIFSSMYFIS